VTEREAKDREGVWLYVVRFGECLDER